MCTDSPLLWPISSPRKAEYTSAEPATFSFVTNGSLVLTIVVWNAPEVVGKLADSVIPAM